MNNKIPSFHEFVAGVKPPESVEPVIAPKADWKENTANQAVVEIAVAFFHMVVGLSLLLLFLKWCFVG